MYSTPEQEFRWNHPTYVRPIGRGGAVHTLHPDTGQPYCGKPGGRRLTESELNSNVPYCRACLNEHTHLVNGERHEASMAWEKKRDLPVPQHVKEWLARRAAAAGVA